MIRSTAYSQHLQPCALSSTPLGRRPDAAVLTADQTSSGCKNCGQGHFYPFRKWHYVLYTVPNTCDQIWGNPQSMVYNSHVVSRGSSWLVSSSGSTQGRASLTLETMLAPGPITALATAEAKTLRPAAPSKAWVSHPRISVSCHRLEARCGAILLCSTVCPRPFNKPLADCLSS